MIGSIRRECLDHLVVLNERQLRRILSEYIAYYNKLRRINRWTGIRRSLVRSNRQQQAKSFRAVTNTAWQRQKAAGATSSDLFRRWLPTLDNLRNFFYAPTAEMKITFELLRQGSLAG